MQSVLDSNSNSVRIWASRFWHLHTAGYDDPPASDIQYILSVIISSLCILCATIVYLVARLAARKAFVVFDKLVEKSIVCHYSCSIEPRLLTTDCANYFTPAYWDENYKRDIAAFEWYTDYSQLRQYIISYVKKTDIILHPGCGTSELSITLAKDGFREIYNVDCSVSLIRTLTSRQTQQGANSSIYFQVVDVEEIPFRNEKFGSIIDKGCLDAVACCPVRGDKKASRVMHEYARVLKPRGVLILASALHPKLCKEYMTSNYFTLVEHDVIRPRMYGSYETHVYVMRRNI